MNKEIFQSVKNAGRKNLNEYQANMIMSGAGIPMARKYVCREQEEALQAAEEFGYPVVMKILSPDILHKTDAGCVRIGINDTAELKSVYDEILCNAQRYNPNAFIEGILVQEMVPQGLELIIGMKKDNQFGPVMMFGLGGIYVEVFQDISLRLAPISKDEAVEMIEETKVSKILKGARGKEYDIEQAVSVLLGISKLVEENKDIEEIDINPFFLYEKDKGGKGVDALISIK